ncbi:Uma2 family endonuclease [Lacipirellula sp.]|uniref:Uma2 family endonuclease n=1 Tax=Lacipirellula sp. TaxID=2691419 RepID=UPI003D1257D7
MASLLVNSAIRNAALPISVEQYHRMAESGILVSDTELLHGVIVQKMVKSPEHTWLVQRLLEWLRGVLPANYHLRQEQPLTFSDSEPEPDLAIVAGDANAYRQIHPATASLVVEVAITSEAIDREKGLAYAAAGVAEYWLVISQKQIVECYRSPSPQGYGEVETLGIGSALRFPLVADAMLPVSEFFRR